ncbi:MAG: hypothetical protein IJV00_10445, partial [Clostridia bacterium]|nr:hypothetical protein [Clostridia bacterium]
VGTRGETPEFFEACYDFLHALDITQLHVFPYSERPGTLAATMPSSVAPSVRRERAARLTERADSVAAAFIAAHAAKEMTVLAEKCGSKYISGHTENFITVRIPSFPGAKPGDLLKVKLDGKSAVFSGTVCAYAEAKEK